MSENLRRLHALVSAKPVLTRNNGMAVAVFGTHSVLFASDDDCAFFVEAYTAVPQLLDQVAAMQAKLDELGEKPLARAQLAYAMLEAERDSLKTQIAKLGELLTKEVAESAAARKRAAAGARVAAKVPKLFRTIENLTKELEAARGR